MSFETPVRYATAARTSGCGLVRLKHTTHIKTIAFEISSRQSLTNPNSVGEILLSEFYRHIGLSENFVVARIERRLQTGAACS